MNAQITREALFNLLNHPENLTPIERSELYTALYSKDPREQGAVGEQLHQAVLALLRRLT